MARQKKVLPEVHVGDDVIFHWAGHGWTARRTVLAIEVQRFCTVLRFSDEHCDLDAVVRVIPAGTEEPENRGRPNQR